MPRRKKVNLKRNIGVDPRFGSELIQRFINAVMWRGKKNVARKIVYEALDELAKKSGGSQDKALETFRRAFEQVAPAVEVRSRRVGGSVYQIPRPVPPNRASILAFRWIIDSAASRSDKTMGKRIGHELMDAIEGRGGAVKKKSEIQRMAEANRAFSHFAW
jgi:small subunit ribosomal protein S7